MTRKSYSEQSEGGNPPKAENTKQLMSTPIDITLFTLTLLYAACFIMPALEDGCGKYINLTAYN